ncbi:TetR/AcrR family transcriptional regulator [Streptomyces sp. NPDC086091]|uniref:TetR/AcrR family transcriptional regulator n=1 Tax=Streptomyces sp. NPDC086091 TaxID=3365751 RepID=UPI0038030545
MARVSQAHLDARRRQILDAASLCFARNGFHATSMQDVLKEADLSAGAVYRYFSGKEELIAAIVTETMAEVREAFQEATRQTPTQLPDTLVTSVLGRTLASRGGVLPDGSSAFPRLVLQVWSEIPRNPELADLLRENYDGVRRAWSDVVRLYQASGTMRADAEPDHVARTMIAAVLGFILQQALFGPTDIEVLRDGLRALMSVTDTDTEADAGAGADAD